MPARKSSSNKVSKIVPLVNQLKKRLVRVPLVMIALTSRCNSQCLMCSYWKSEKQDFPEQFLTPLAADLATLKCQSVGLTGGEPLLHPHFEKIIAALKHQKRTLFLITNGTLLEQKYNDQLFENFKAIYVSLDGPDALTHDAIRGQGAFLNMSTGINYLKSKKPSIPLIARCTIQKKNWRLLPNIVETAFQQGFDAISFVSVDSYSHAYGQKNSVPATTLTEIVPSQDDISEMSKYQAELLARLKIYFQKKFILEAPEKILTMFDYLAAVAGKSSFPPVFCNAPLFSLFINQQAEVSPCFFRPPIGSLHNGRLIPLLNQQTYSKIRIDEQVYQTYCRTCTCALFRGFRFPGRAFPGRAKIRT
ncbi:radical SAM protein [candidate division CSSED10-310 bacterium]|uniref:Radical SAM protein n=1 Tax=candidate division CSSED10-310 bacterium TaxID=2855610 RepID=A0ABV6YRX6_UNCC1